MEGEAVATHERWAFVGSIEKIDLLTENLSFIDLFQWFTRESCYDIYMLCLVIGTDFYYPYSFLLLFFWNFLPCPFPPNHFSSSFPVTTGMDVIIEKEGTCMHNCRVQSWGAGRKRGRQGCLSRKNKLLGVNFSSVFFIFLWVSPSGNIKRGCGRNNLIKYC